MDYRRISVDPLTPTIGAEISGVDLREPLDDDTFEEVHGALVEHSVIFFRDQAIDHEQHLAFGRRFGGLHVHPAAPCVEGNPELMLIHTDASSTRQNGDDWHSDVSCDEEPPMGSVLHLHKVPESGGDTLFSSMYAAWEALSEPMKALLAPLEARHESAHLYDGIAGRGLYGDATVRRRNEWPSAVHPVVRTHPVSGCPALYVNRILHPPDPRRHRAREPRPPRLPVRARHEPALPVPLRPGRAGEPAVAGARTRSPSGTTAACSTTRCGTTTRRPAPAPA